ncbi:hypothetical protein ACE0DR_25155 [Azotobacter sp. CWF10]
MQALQQASAAGSAFVFGFIGGGAAPYAVTSPANGFVLAFQALPLVLVISALSALLFHWRVLPVIVRDSPGCCRKPSASAAPWASPAPPMSSSA